MKSIIAYFIKYPVAGNVLLLIILVFGLISLGQMRSSFFPETPSRSINIQVIYPGASPTEVEEGVILKIEDELKGLSGIERVTSVSMENSGSLIIEVERGSNPDLVLQDVKNSVDRISSFPLGMEPLIVFKVESTTLAMSVALHGEVNLHALKALAREMERDMLTIEGISKVELGGFPEEEIAINLREDALRAYDLSFGEVMEKVRAGNLEITGGTVKGPEEELLIRYDGKGYFADDLRNLVIKTGDDGRIVRLVDIANVEDTWEENPTRSEYNGRPSVTVDVYNTNTEDILFITDTVRNYVQAFNERNDQVEASIVSDSSITLRQRIDTLKVNGMQGIFLVIILLAFFLHLRLAFWVALSIPICFAGMFILAAFFGITINVISLFGMIVVIGILVDDGIVVSENIYRQFEMGKSRMRAAIDGTMEVLPSVFAAILTTMVAFSSFFFIGGRLGDFFSEMSFIVMATLFFSLIEGFIILPAHVAHSRALDSSHKSNWLLNFTNRVMIFLRDGLYAPVLNFCLRNRALAVSIAIFMFIVALGSVKGGFVKTTFFPFIERDEINVNLGMPAGTRESITKNWLDHIEQAVWLANEELKSEREDSLDVVLAVDKRLGISGSHTGRLTVRLLDTEQRQMSVLTITEAMRRFTGPVPEAEQLTFGAFSAFGKPISIGMRGNDMAEVRAASEELKAELNNLSELKDVTDNDQEGQRELHLELTEKAYLLGLSAQDVLAQVRQGFFGGEVQRLQRGLDEVKVWVRYEPEDRERVEQLGDMRIRTPDGRSFPLAELALITQQRGTLAINHTDGQREILVEADVASSKTSVTDLISSIERSVLPPILARHPGVRYGFEGQYREQAKSAQSMQTVLPVIILLMLSIIVLTFRSFMQTLIVFLLLPFSYAGVVFGHYMHDKPISFFSVLGIIALIGIMVNDALVFVSAYNNNLRDGKPVSLAVRDASLSRFRPILLTSITTIAGLTPLILNKSFQAQFLIPMAISVAYGLLMATLINLLLLPTLLSSFNSLQRFVQWFWNDTRVSPESVEPAVQELEQEPAERVVPVGSGGSGVVGLWLILFVAAGLGGAGTVSAQGPAQGSSQVSAPGATASLVQQDTLSLDEALAMAMEQNLSIKLSRSYREIAQNNAHPGMAGLLPGVSANGGWVYGLNNTRLQFASPDVPDIEQNNAASQTTTGSVTMNYELNGPGPFRTYRWLKGQALVAGAEHQMVVESIGVQVLGAYYGLSRSRQNLEAVAELLEISAERYERAKVRESFGAGSSLELLQAQVALNSDSASLLDAQQAMDQSLHNLNYLLGRAADAPVLTQEAANTTEGLELSALRQRMEQYNAELSVAELQERNSLLDWQVARAGFWPSLSVSAGYGYSLNVNDAGFIVNNRNLGFTGGLNLSVPLFTGQTRRIAANNSEIAYQNRILQKEDLQRRLEADLLDAWSSYTNALRMLSMQRTAVRTAEASMDQLRERFNMGQVDATTYREAQVQWLLARNGLNNARYNARLAEAEVLRLAGLW